MKIDVRKRKQFSKTSDARKGRKRANVEQDWEELASDITLLKKFKKGRLGKKELNEKFIV